MSTAAYARTLNSYAGAIFRPKVDGQLLEGLEALLLAACRPRNAESQFPAPVTAAASQSSYWIESKHCLVSKRPIYEHSTCCPLPDLPLSESPRRKYSLIVAEIRCTLSCKLELSSSPPEHRLSSCVRPRSPHGECAAEGSIAVDFSIESAIIFSTRLQVYRARTVADMHRYGASDTFKPDAGPWPEEYSAQEVKDQRARGKRALEAFRRGLSDGRTSFKFECGVYRVDAPFEAAGVNGLSICAQDVEIILEATEWCAHFQLLGCTDVRIHGPLILDSAPFGFSQVRVLAFLESGAVVIGTTRQKRQQQEGRK